MERSDFYYGVFLLVVAIAAAHLGGVVGAVTICASGVAACGKFFIAARQEQRDAEEEERTPAESSSP